MKEICRACRCVECVWPIIDPWETSVLTGYSCKSFPSKTTWSHLLTTPGVARNQMHYHIRVESIISGTEKYKIRSNTCLEIPKDLSLCERPVCQTLSKDLIHCDSFSSSRLRKVSVILSDTTVGRPAVDWEDLNVNQIKDHISGGDQQAYYLQVFQRLF